MSEFATDKLYYILDYSGNYYRTDAQDRLVVAGDEENATIFSFVDANIRIGSGNKKKFYYMLPVTVNRDVEIAVGEDDMIENETGEATNTEADFQITNQVEEIDGDETSEPEEGVAEPQESISDVTITVAKGLTEAETVEEIEKSMGEYDLFKMDWKEYLTHFTYLASEVRKYRENLVHEESDVDRKICDVLHYIELRETGEDEAADLVELLRVCRENRRRIKDELIRVDAFQRSLGTNGNMAKVKDALKTINGLETRQYIPRKFTELFVGSVLQPSQKKERMVSDCGMTVKSILTASTFRKEESDMEYTRRETPFDGKANNWLAFAAQQAEFYRNANQYIVNLQLDLEEIDAEIAGLMEEIDNANCNVTQGYKLFRKLKELRMTRKDKLKELDCLYVLTDHFDTDAMAEECEANAEAIGSMCGGEGCDAEKDES